MHCPSCHHLNQDDVDRCGRCGALLSRTRIDLEEEFSPGKTVLGRYQLGVLLGEGAVGKVFQAHDQLLGRTVALKVLSRDLWDSSKARERMAREAAALGRIMHPNVIGIFNVFEQGEALILELEYVEGGTLADRLNQGPFTLSEAVRVMSGILEGLEAVHAAGIVHRDLKPANILMTRDGIPKLADLGIARDLTASPMTRAGTALGTAEYMSPEQIRGGAVGPPTDVYACGILLYELIAGRVPFQHKSEYQVMSAHLEQAPNLAVLQAKAPALLVHVVARALAKAPDHRFATARELRQALLKAGQRHRGRPPSDPNKAAKPRADAAAIRLPSPAEMAAAPLPKMGPIVVPPGLAQTVSSRFSPRGDTKVGRYFPVILVLAMLGLFLVLLVVGLLLIGSLQFGSDRLLGWRSWSEESPAVPSAS